MEGNTRRIVLHLTKQISFSKMDIINKLSKYSKLSHPISDMIFGSLDEFGTFPRTTEWTIPYFFELPQHVGFAVYSKEFSFMEMKCWLELHPHGYNSLPNIMTVALYGISKDGFTRWELEILRANGTVLQKCTGCKEDGAEMEMSMHIPLEDVEKGCSAQGFMKLTCKLYNADATSYYEEESKNDKSSQTDEISSPDKLSCDMEELMLREDYSDVTIKVQNQEYKAHKAVLGVRIPVFANIFRRQMTENVHSVVEIDECDAVTFREFLRYLYASRVQENSPEVLFPLHQVADKYQMIDLKLYCLEQIKCAMYVDNFCQSAVLCFKYNEERFKDIVSQFFAENMSDIRKTEEWENFESENPEGTDELIQKALRYQVLTANSKQYFLQKIVKSITGRE